MIEIHQAPESTDLTNCDREPINPASEQIPESAATGCECSTHASHTNRSRYLLARNTANHGRTAAVATRSICFGRAESQINQLIAGAP